MQRGDYAVWFLDVIRDEELARSAAAVGSGSGDPAEARRLIVDAIEERYVIPDRTRGEQASRT